MPLKPASSTSTGLRVEGWQLPGADKRLQDALPLVVRQTNSPPPRHRSLSFPNNDNISWNHTDQQPVRHVDPKNRSFDANSFNSTDSKMSASFAKAQAAGTAELNLQSSPTPPIRELLSEEEVISAVNKMTENINKDWKKIKQLVSKPDPQRTEQIKWNKRIQETTDILTRFKEQATLFGNKWSCLKDGSIFGYFVDDQPVGLIAMLKATVPEVDLLVTHPGLQGCGGILIERAVQLSKKWGGDGKLTLYADNKNAKQAYLSLGFRVNSQDSEFDLTFDPANINSTNNIWCTHNGELRLERYINKQYVG